LCKRFFYNPQSCLWFHFIHSQLKAFSVSVQKTGSGNISATEVAEELTLAERKKLNIKSANFHTSTAASILAKLQHQGLFTEAKCVETVNSSYDTFVLFRKVCSSICLSNLFSG
jgi:hypothetical protein